jgi:hypothetical protein
MEGESRVSIAPNLGYRPESIHRFHAPYSCEEGIMTRYFVDSAIRLNTGELLDINDGEGFTIECREGAIWITQSNDPRDIVLRAGQSFVLDKPGLALVCAAAGPATLAVAVSLQLLRRARSRLQNSTRIRQAA